MKRRDISAKTGAMLLLCVFYLVGGGGCADQLLPPDPTSSEPAREVLVYLNQLAVGMAPDEIDLSRSTIVAKRPDGTSERVIASGLVSSSPQNGRIAYYHTDPNGIRPSGIYIANDDGTNASLFEPTVAEIELGLNPWSVQLGPDGQSVAWVASDALGSAMLIVRTPEHRWEIALDVLTDKPAELSVPRFSPDGSYVAYANVGGDLFNASGSIKLVQTSTGFVRDVEANIMPSFAGMVSPPFDWAPDSRRILYAGIVVDETYKYSSEPMVINIASGRTDTLMHDGMIKESPRWLPGGNQICYVGLSETNGADLFLRDNTGQIRRLTHDESTFKIGLTISPDGRTALFTEFSNIDQTFGTVRAFDLVRLTAGPVLAIDTDMGHWRR